MKKIFISILLILVLISLGCKRFTTPDIEEPEVIEYHKGTQGLEMSLIKNLPPGEIIEGGEFVIGLELRNKGAYDIKDGRISIYGFEDGYVAIFQPDMYFNIEGKKPGFPEGGYEILNFEAKNIAIPEIAEKYSAPFTISAYYNYQTEAGIEVCINPNLYSYIRTKETVCEPETITTSGGQGAPVAVTKVEEQFSPLGGSIKVNFVIHFADKGDGKVVGGVRINEVRLSNVPISCETDYIELKGKEEKYILCTTETLPSAGSYIAPLSIKLSYDYTSKIDKTLNVRALRRLRES